MKIVARVPREDANLVATLTERGINAKLVRNATIVELRRTADGYEIPSEVDVVDLRIDVAESGGGATNTGNGVIVAGISGKALRSYHQPRRGSLACGTHAYFSEQDVTTVTASRHRSDVQVSIQGHWIEVSGQTAQIAEKVIWEGEPESLPETFDRFAAAVQAAVAKSQCYHCRESHYVAT